MPPSPPQTPHRLRATSSGQHGTSPTRTYGTPRRRKPPTSTRLQGIKPANLTLDQISDALVSKLVLNFLPDAWQVQLISRIRQGYDSIFIAGTGYGKSLIFEGLAALGGAKKALIIISPLKALERDQVAQAMQKGLKAILINEDNAKTAGLWKEARTKAQMVYISPEMALSPSFINLWKDASFRKRVQAVIVDEAHCIDEWGEEFRPKYRELEMLRSFTGQEVPFVACTATCATSTFEVIWKSLGFGNRPFWGIDVGCDRPNLLFLARPLVNTKNPVLDILDFLPKDLDETTPLEAISKGLCYYDSEAACGHGVKTWRQALPEHLRGCVFAFSSGISEEAKRQCWEGFVSGRYRIICCTDAAGMGCNVPDVAFTVIFGCPRSLSVVSQRWGRTGRDRRTPGTCLLLVPAWAYRPSPPAVGAAVQRVRGKAKLKVEPQTHTAQRANLEKSLEAFINSGLSSTMCCSHGVVSQVFRPKTGLTTYSSLASTTATVGRRSEQSVFELSWTELDLDRSPPRDRCCSHCNPNLLAAYIPSNQNDPRLLKFARDFIHPFPDPPPTRPASQASATSDVSQVSQATINFEPPKGSRAISKGEKDHLRSLLIDWRLLRHRRHGNSCFLAPEIALPPKQLEKLVSGSGAFLKRANIGQHEILKVISWDFATDRDFREVAGIIDDWRLAITVSNTPASQTRARKKNRADENTDAMEPIPQPVFTPVPRAPRQADKTPRASALHMRNLFQTPTQLSSSQPPSQPSQLSHSPAVFRPGQVVYETPVPSSRPIDTTSSPWSGPPQPPVLYHAPHSTLPPQSYTPPFACSPYYPPHFQHPQTPRYQQPVPYFSPLPSSHYSSYPIQPGVYSSPFPHSPLGYPPQQATHIQYQTSSAAGPSLHQAPHFLPLNQRTVPQPGSSDYYHVSNYVAQLPHAP